MSASFLLLLAAPFALPTDEFVPYPDGTPGGCYRSARGEFYDCTPPPAGSTTEDAARAELMEVRRELEELKRRQAEDDARRAEQLAREDDARRAVRAEEARERDQAMAAWRAIEGAKDSARLRELESKTAACRPQLEKQGFRVVGPGACRDRDGAYVNCPEC